MFLIFASPCSCFSAYVQPVYVCSRAMYSTHCSISLSSYNLHFITAELYRNTSVFIVYFMTLLVSQIRHRRKVVLMNNELEKFERILSSPIRDTIPTFAWRYWARSQDSRWLVRTSNRTPPNTNLELFRYTSLPGHTAVAARIPTRIIIFWHSLKYLRSPCLPAFPFLTHPPILITCSFFNIWHTQFLVWKLHFSVIIH
jgi:hypothetical protein